MRAVLLWLALVLAAALAHADVPGSEADVASIHAIVADLDEAWARADADRWASHYAPQAQFINILGMVMPDVPSMRARHHEIFTGVFAGSRHHGSVRSLRFLTPDVAIADVDIEVTGFKALPPGARPTEPGVLRTRMRHVLQRLEGRWRITATQNTAVAPAP